MSAFRLQTELDIEQGRDFLTYDLFDTDHARGARGYIGADAMDWLACPLLFQVAEEMRTALPAVIGELPLIKLWAFKYDHQLQGIDAHADAARVNVNFWITPDEACVDPTMGGSTSAPSGSCGAVAGVAGSLGATEAIKLLTGIGQPLAGRLLHCDLRTMRFHTVHIKRDPRCAEHAGLFQRLQPGFGEDHHVELLASGKAAGNRIRRVAHRGAKGAHHGVAAGRFVERDELLVGLGECA